MKSTLNACLIGMAILVACLPAAHSAVRIKAGMTIRHSITFQKENYRLTDPGKGIIVVSGNNITINLSGSDIMGNGKGVGIHVINSSNVLIENAKVSHCQWGVIVEKSHGVRISNGDFSRNADLPVGTVIDESGAQPQDNNGGGILLRDSDSCVVRHVTANHQWDGIDLVRSNNNNIEYCDFSYLNNWGVHFWLSSRNRFEHNRAIWCTTGEGLLWQSISGWQTYDSAAVLIEHASMHNLIEDCDLRYGGDGVYIRANEGPITPNVPVPPKNASNDNQIIGCDCSYSPNNAIEADLCDRNVFIRDNCSYSNYGFWLGLSRWNRVLDCIALNNSTRGMEIEGGQNDIFKRNLFGNTSNPSEIQILLRLTSRPEIKSGPYLIQNNLFYNSNHPIYLNHTAAKVAGNKDMLRTMRDVNFIQTDMPSMLTQSDNKTLPMSKKRLNIKVTNIAPAPSEMGWDITATGFKGAQNSAPPLIMVDSIPMQIVASQGPRIVFRLPGDLWNLTYRPKPVVKVWMNGEMSNAFAVPYHYPKNAPCITFISPNPVAPGEQVVIKGEYLTNPEGKSKVLLNNEPADIVRATPTEIVLNGPSHKLSSVSLNLVVVNGKFASLPMPLTIKVPADQVPHIITASFSPTTLHVGELLKVVFTLKNFAPFALPARKPTDNFTYDEDQNFWGLGYQEKQGSIYLRVDSERTGGSWPYYWGLPQPLQPGQTATVTGYIKVEHPGKMIWRIGMVDAGIRWLDDNEYRTEITILPAK